MKIDWKRKLTSRKFWAAVVGFVTSIMLGFGVADTDAAEVASIIMAAATLIAYIFGEGLVDASGALDTFAEEISPEEEQTEEEE